MSKLFGIPIFICLICQLIPLSSGCAQETWSGAAKMRFASKTENRTVKGSASSEPITVSVSPSGKVSGKIDLDTASVRLDELKDKLFEQVVRQVLKSVTIECNDLGLEDTSPKDSGGSAKVPTQVPLLMKVNGKPQSIVAQVVSWSPGGDTLSCSSTFQVSLKASEITIPSLVKIEDAITVQVVAEIKKN